MKFTYGQIRHTHPPPPEENQCLTSNQERVDEAGTDQPPPPADRCANYCTMPTAWGEGAGADVETHWPQSNRTHISCSLWI
jgi:hypothetical protein